MKAHKVYSVSHSPLLLQGASINHGVGFDDCFSQCGIPVLPEFNSSLGGMAAVPTCPIFLLLAYFSVSLLHESSPYARASQQRVLLGF